MSDLHWAVWSFVQHAKGNPAEDFWGYGLGRLGCANARMSTADFGRHVGVVHRGGRPRVLKRAHRVDPEKRKPAGTIPKSG